MSEIPQTDDALVWAEEFCKRYPSALSQIEGKEGAVQGDDFKDIMVGWFANAIETVRVLDEASTRRAGEPKHPELVVHRQLAWLRGYAAAQKDENLLGVVEMIEKSITTTYDNFLERGSQLDRFAKEVDDLKSRFASEADHPSVQALEQALDTSESPDT